jgi:DNA mismatch endonuclease (patch repair protein)
VHGCFWHQHRKPSCRIKRIPRSNLDYWLPKLRRNVSRDSKNQRALKELDWDLLVIWECELANLDLVIGRLERFMAR